MTFRHTMPDGIEPIEAQPYLLGTEPRVAFRFSRHALRVVLHGFVASGGNAAERALIATQDRRAKAHSATTRRRIERGPVAQVSQVDMQEAIGLPMTAMSVLRAERSDMVRAAIDPNSGLETKIGTVVLGHLTTDYVVRTIDEREFETSPHEAMVLSRVVEQYDPFKLPLED